MRIIDIETEDEWSRQADDAHQPQVEAMPTRATDQKSETISEIQRSHIHQGTLLATEPRAADP